ncbi:MAG: hypothetical protein DRJ64_02500 [Thermoprotei archaeon]|nr:MAG: hypothetical protein DRJ64_02500 [Thermoprotei archaeon]
MTGKREGRLFSDLEASVIVGKGGLGEGMIAEIKRVAKGNRYFKIKILKSAPLTLEEIGNKVQDAGIAELIGKRGRVGLFKSKVFRPPSP